MKKQGSIGIVVSGGPAPGINSVISAAAIEGINRGYSVFGLVDGFKGITERGIEAALQLSIEQVSRIHHTGGSIIGTSRYNPFKEPEKKKAFLETLSTRGINQLIVIGGEGSAWLSHELTTLAPELSVVHVPKTIDNDLVLPNKHPSFGFETARDAGTKILETLSVDAQTCRRWFIITTMGRKAGFLALGLGLSAGTTLSIIPEEFPEKIPVRRVAEIIMSSIERRLAEGKAYGVALLAEGVLEVLDPGSSPLLKNSPRDELGRMRYSEVELGQVVVPELRALCKERGKNVSFVEKNIGYELRCHPPTSFDLEYTKFLGCGAVELLSAGKKGVMVTRDFDRLGFQELSSMIKPDGSIVARKVDISSDLYRVARRYMIRD